MDEGGKGHEEGPKRLNKNAGFVSPRTRGLTDEKSGGDLNKATQSTRYECYQRSAGSAIPRQLFDIVKRIQVGDRFI